MIALKENGNRLDCTIEQSIFEKALALCVDDLTSVLTPEEKIHYHYEKFVYLSIHEAVNAAYQIKRITPLEIEDKELKLNVSRQKIVGLLQNIYEYDDRISEKERSNGILEILNQCLGKIPKPTTVKSLA